MGSRDLWIDLDSSLSAVSHDLYWSQQFLDVPVLVADSPIFVQSGVSSPQISGANTEAMLWSWLMQVFWWKTRGVKKGQHRWGNGIFFIKFLEVFCDWAWKNLNHQSCWNCWVIFQKFVLSFLRNDKSIIRKFVFARSQTFFSFAPSRIDSGLRTRQCYLKGQSNEAFVHVWYFIFSRATPFDQEFWIWRSLRSLFQ